MLVKINTFPIKSVGCIILKAAPLPFESVVNV
jgi:hypothetical protein